jgi:DNA-binding NarL/FixJ family response regulator
MTDVLPSLRTEVLPPNCTITIQSVGTHAIQEAVLDDSYRILVYDADLQSPEVRAKYAAFTPLHMATLTLRAMGVDWETTETALTDEEGNRPKLDDRLADDFFAGRAIGYCFREGLIRAQMISLEETATPLGRKHLTKDYLEVLNLFAGGAVSPRHHQVRNTLQLLGELGGEESPLLALLTKSTVTKLKVRPHADIVYRRSLVTENKRLLLEPTAKPAEEGVRSATYIKQELKDKRKAFCAYLQRGLETWTEQTDPIILWKNTAFTFRLTDFTPRQRSAIMCTTFGARIPGVDSLSEHKSDATHHDKYYELSTHPGIKTLLGLFLLRGGYLLYDQPVALDDNPHKPNLEFLQYYVNCTAWHQTFSTTNYDRNKARYYLYNEIGVASLAEALLALGTQGFVHLPQTIKPAANSKPAVLLTPREQQVLDLVAQGYTNGEIGETLDITKETVRGHVYNIRKKTGVSTRIGAIVSVYGDDLPLRVKLKPEAETIVRLLGQGLGNKAIAAEMGLGVRAVKDRLRRIFLKVGAKNRSQALSILFDVPNLGKE